MNTQRILMLDAAMSGAAGLAMIAGAGVLAPWLNLPAPLLQIAVSNTALKAVISVNVLWVAASLAALFVLSPNGWGIAFVLAQAFAVAVFAALQIGALKRAAAA